MSKLRLGVNIDHVATLRNARGGALPDPVRAAVLAQECGADGITAHLREDRRHMRDADIPAILEAISIPLNFEMAATEEMQAIALAHRPHAACIVPEKREERTTEGGLNVAADDNRLADFIAPLIDGGMRVSMFIEADPKQIETSARIGAPVVELHTGTYCDAVAAGNEDLAHSELKRLSTGAEIAVDLGLEVHMGHGLTYDCTPLIAAIPAVAELNIGHFLMGEAMFVGLPAAMAEMRSVMDKARSEPSNAQ